MAHIFEDNQIDRDIDDASVIWLLCAIGFFAFAFWIKRRREQVFRIQNNNQNVTQNNAQNQTNQQQQQNQSQSQSQSNQEFTNSNVISPDSNWNTSSSSSSTNSNDNQNSNNSQTLRNRDHSSNSSNSQNNQNNEDFFVRINWRNVSRNEKVNPQTLTIGELKRLCFSEQIAQNLSVRLLFRGRILVNDSQTLSQVGVVESGQTLMAVVTHIQPDQAHQQQMNDGRPRQTDFFSLIPGGENSLLFGTIGFSLICFWLLFYYHHDQFGSFVNYALITIITGIYTMFVLSFFQSQRIQRATSN